MRTWGRVNGIWTEVQTDANGHDDYVWITTLIQCLKLSPGESPFFSNYGIPAQQSLVTQIFPDFFVALTQSQFAQYFATLNVSKQPPAKGTNNPTYLINLITNQGTVVNQTIAV